MPVQHAAMPTGRAPSAEEMHGRAMARFPKTMARLAGRSICVPVRPDTQDGATSVDKD